MKKYHFIGIKGSGMSALAQIMHKLGNYVQGSDLDTHFFTQIELDKLNIKLLPYNKNNIQEGFEIIKGASFDESHEEVIRAKELNLKIHTYMEMLQNLIQSHIGICVTGCHGKTTTTSILSHVLNNLKGSNYLIGDGTGFVKQGNKYFVLEACEYKRHFLNYFPEYIIITNIDLDHTDYYKDMDDVMDAYNSFANNAKKLIIACGDDKNSRLLKTNNKIIYYGINNDNNVVAKNIKYTSKGTSFDVYIDNKNFGSFDIPIFSKNLLLDVLSVITLCYLENLTAYEIEKELKTYKGCKRRFSQYQINDSIVIDDYAHHPNEIKTIIEATKQKYPNKDIICIMQPHMFTRVRDFYLDFAKELNQAQKTYMLDIYKAREKQSDFPGITSQTIIDNLDNGEAIKIDEASKLLKHKGSVFLFLSPNDISQIINDLKNLLKK